MKLGFQFHAGRDEVTRMAQEWALAEGLLLAWEQFFPVYRVHMVEGGGVLNLSMERIDRISLSLHPIDVNVSSSVEYLRRNPSLLTMDFGHESASSLSETFLSAMTEDEDCLSVWKKLRNLARKSTLKGAWATNIVTGTRARYDSHRYTEKARELSNSGVRMLGASDWIEFEFD